MTTTCQSNRPVNETERDLYRAVLGYLTRNPNAMDTLDGIAEWWVMRQHIHTSVSALSRVLRRLVEDGLVEDIGPVERPRYRLRKRSGAGTRSEENR
jgi:hypothetical protein